MIAPEFRQCDNMTLLQPAQSFISQNYGDELWNDLKHELTLVEQIHNQLPHAAQQKTNPAQLEKFQDLFLQNYRNMTSFGKYFVFGNSSTTLNLSFTWYDSYTHKKVVSQSPLLAQLSSLYNMGVCLARRGCFMDLGGDGIKMASKNFRNAAWLFDYIQKASSQMTPDSHSTDFNKETLVMNSNLCLAQAQYLFFKKASDAGMNPKVLAKVSAQVAIYFKKAYESCQVSADLRGFQDRRFQNVLAYHSCYFEAMAWWQLGSQQFQAASDAGKGMNLSVAYLEIAVGKYTEAQPFARALGGAYLSNFEAKFNEAQRLHAQAVDENKKIFYERQIAREDVPKLDPQNFATFDSVEEDLQKKAPIEQKLMHVVPPPVRAMQDELKQILNGTIQEEFSKCAQFDEQMNAFLSQFGLPQTLHSLTATSDVPDDVWKKIEEFQKKGAAQNFSQAIQSAESLKQVNTDVMNQVKSVVDAEEAEDTQLRQQHGVRFNRPPSGAVNQAYKQGLFDYQQKIEQAGMTDNQIKQKFEANTEGFALLSKTRQDLSALIPQSASAQGAANNPAVLAVKDCLNQLEDIRQQKERVMNDGVAMHEQISPVEELLKVHQNQAQKGEVFEAFKAKYREHFAQNEALEAQKQAITQSIAQNGPQIQQIVSSMGNDPAKGAFFQKINEAIVVQEQLSMLLEQGTNFYMQLNDILMRLQQSVNDFKFSRDMQKNELLTQMGVPAGGQPPQQPGMPQPGMPQPGMQQAMQGWQMPAQMQQPQQPGGAQGYGMPQVQPPSNNFAYGMPQQPQNNNNHYGQP